MMFWQAHVSLLWSMEVNMHIYIPAIECYYRNYVGNICTKWAPIRPIFRLSMANKRASHSVWPFLGTSLVLHVICRLPASTSMSFPMICSCKGYHKWPSISNVSISHVSTTFSMREGTVILFYFNLLLFHHSQHWQWRDAIIVMGIKLLVSQPSTPAIDLLKNNEDKGKRKKVPPLLWHLDPHFNIKCSIAFVKIPPNQHLHIHITYIMS